ncbi:MAG: hypothetical protein EU549_01800 [Promethearchaeota archaeon]|nr:MAG: hypothetical protein EU549_01800 [Candidatus Lokiarchaeota archaeon]
MINENTNNQSTNNILNKKIIKIKDDLVIKKRDALDFFKRNEYKNLDFISETLLKKIIIKNRQFFMHQSFGLISNTLIKYCKALLNINKKLVFFWPKLQTKIIAKIPVFLMDPKKNIGILVYIDDLNLLRTA